MNTKPMNTKPKPMTRGEAAFAQVTAVRRTAMARAILSERLSIVCHLVATAISEAEFSDPPDDLRDDLRDAARTLEGASSKARRLARGPR